MFKRKIKIVFHSHRFCQSLFNMIFSFFGQISGWYSTVQYIARWKIIGHQCIWHSFLQEIVLQELSPQFRHVQSFVGKRGSIASYSVTRFSFIYLHSDISGFCPNSWLSQWQVEFRAVLKRKLSNSLISRTVPSLAQHFPRQCKVKLNAFPDSAKSSSTLSRTVQSLYISALFRRVRSITLRFPGSANSRFTLSGTVPSLAEHFPGQCKVKLSTFQDSAKSLSELFGRVPSFALRFPGSA